MSHHPHVAWLTRPLNESPARPERGRRVMKAVDVPGLARVIRGRFPPIECYRFWEFHCPGFTTSIRDLRADDVSERSRTRVRRALAEIPTVSRNRLLLKITGWPRLQYLDALLGKTRFVHVRRDGRAVANSLMNVAFWRGWQGPAQWRWGSLSDEHAQEWEAHDRSFVALAGIHWKIQMGAIAMAVESVGRSNVLEIDYSDLCANPVDTCRAVTDFCGLEWTVGFQRAVTNTVLRNTNDKWMTDLTRTQQAVLSQVLTDDLIRYGFGT
jgi:hypothetical protein